MLLTNNNFAQFYDQLQYTTNVYADLGQSIKVLRLVKEDLKQAKTGRDKKKTYENLKAELEEKRKAGTDQSKAKENLLVQTKSSELKYKTLLASLKQQYQAEINEQRAYEDQVRKNSLNKIN